MKSVVVFAMVITGCGGVSAAQKQCAIDAQNRWRYEVALCAQQGKSADDCGLDGLTEIRRLEEEACLR